MLATAPNAPSGGSLHMPRQLAPVRDCPRTTCTPTHAAHRAPPLTLSPPHLQAVFAFNPLLAHASQALGRQGTMKAS